jgi:hypothetical protein
VTGIVFHPLAERELALASNGHRPAFCRVNSSNVVHRVRFYLQVRCVTQSQTWGMSQFETETFPNR